MQGRDSRSSAVLRTWLFTALAFAVLGVAPAAAAEPFEVEEYQRILGVSQEQAEENLEIQHRGIKIVDDLRRALRERYAGVWFDNQEGEFVVPVPPGINATEVRGALTKDGLAQDFRVQAAKFSWTELESAQQELDSSLREQIDDGVVATSLDPRSNSVLINQADGADRQDRSKIRSEAIDADVTVEIRPEDVTRFGTEPLTCSTGSNNFSCDPPLRAGVGLFPFSAINPLCTAAFKAIGNSNGGRYMLTAGHCMTGFPLGTPEPIQWSAQDAAPTFESTSSNHHLGIAEQWKFPGGDWAKIGASGSSFWDTAPWPSSLIVWPKAPGAFVPATNSEYKIFGEGTSYVGLQVCHSGVVTGSSCALVTKVNASTEYGVDHATFFGPACGDHGDSGGPVYAGNAAIGIFSGADDAFAVCNRPLIYTEITEATSALGVQVARSTETTAGVSQVLNGNPGWASISGEVKSNGASISGGNVNVNFSKWENNQWVYKKTGNATVSSNFYLAANVPDLGKGKWRAKAVFFGTGTFSGSESDYKEFEIKDGYQLVNVNSGKCMDVKGISVANHASIQQYSCLNPAQYQNQVFTLVPEGNFYYRLVARHSGRCVDVENASQTTGAWLQQFDCIANQNNQIWKGQGVSGGTQFIAKHSSKCADVFNSGNQDGATVVQWVCTGGPNQLWTFKSVESAQIPTSVNASVDEVLNGQPGFVSVSGNLNVGGYPLTGKWVNLNYKKLEGGNWNLKQTVPVSAENGGHFEHKYAGLGTGTWRVRVAYLGDSPLAASDYETGSFDVRSGYRLKNRYSDKCMSVSENKGNNGQAIIQWDCNGNPSPGDGQVFTMVPVVGQWPFYQFRFNSTGKCLDVTSASTADGAWLQQWECGTQSNQLWEGVGIQGQSPWMAFRPKHSGKCIDIIGPSKNNSVRLHQWGCHWGGSQQWEIQSIN